MDKKLRAAALWYAKEKNWPIFPVHTVKNGRCSCGKKCTSPGKHPRTQNGFHDATTKEKQILQWWEKWPDANIGIPTGEISGIIVLDQDTEEGQEFLRTKHLPPTTSQRTGGGGNQYLFRWPGYHVQNFARKLPGIDFRGDGGYIIVPPSLHPSGNLYEWTVTPKDEGPAPCPDWLLEVLATKKQAAPGEQLPDKIREGEGRNSFLTSFAGTLRHKGLSEKELFDHLQIMNRKRCAPPLDESEVRKIAQSVGRYEPGRPETKQAAAREVVASLMETAAATDVGQVYDSAAALALLPADELGKIKASLKEKFGKLLNMNDLAKAVNEHRRKHLRVVQEGEPPVFKKLSDVFANFPEAGELVAPAGWEINTDGIHQQRMTEGGAVLDLVAPYPALIKTRLVDVNDNTEAVRLIWLRDGRWQEHIVERSIIANARELVSLSGHGAPVTSSNAGLLVQFFADFEAVNIKTLPVERVTSKLGWQKDHSCFLSGRQALYPQGSIVGKNMDKVKSVQFQAANIGDDEIADSFQARGTLEEWRDLVELANPYPRAMLALYASLAAPLLPIIGAPNFTVDLSFATSSGKTTASRLAASVWGNPDERLPEAMIGGWDTTRVGVERRAALLSGLPLFLDDSAQAKRVQDIESIVYAIANGQGRTRGALKGLQQTARWHTVGISTGETPLGTFCKGGGARARVLEIWGAPFGKSNRQVVDQINQSVMKYHGTAGAEYVQWLLDHKTDWGYVRNLWRNHAEILVDKGSSAVAGRLADFFAVICAAQDLAVTILGIHGPDLTTLWKEIVTEGTEADRAMKALEYVISSAQANEEAFVGRELMFRDGETRVPVGGWWGKWDRGIETGLMFYPHKLGEILERGSFDYEATLRLWADKGWIETSGDRKRYQKRVRVAGDLSWLVVISPPGWREVIGNGDED